MTHQEGDENLEEEKMAEQAPKTIEKSMNESDTLEIEEEILKAKLQQLRLLKAKKQRLSSARKASISKNRSKAISSKDVEEEFRQIVPPARLSPTREEAAATELARPAKEQ